MYKPLCGTPEDIMAQFTARHSCQHCKEEAIDALNAESYPIAFLRDSDKKRSMLPAADAEASISQASEP